LQKKKYLKKKEFYSSTFKMGNDCCVATGAGPNSMGFVLLNNSSKKMTLSNEKCANSCGIHKGFSADHGKFRVDWTPLNVIGAGESSKCWMSGREGAPIKPSGWIKYNIEDGGILTFRFDDNGLKAEISHDCSSINVSVNTENIERDMSEDFAGTDTNRQFLILVSDSTVN
jgi:hypothetical protein